MAKDCVLWYQCRLAFNCVRKFENGGGLVCCAFKYNPRYLEWIEEIKRDFINGDDEKTQKKILNIYFEMINAKMKMNTCKHFAESEVYHRNAPTMSIDAIPAHDRWVKKYNDSRFELNKLLIKTPKPLDFYEDCGTGI